MYSPSEDSFFFIDFLKKFFHEINKKEREKIKVLDMGSGTGILAETCSFFVPKENILCVDIQEESVNLLKRKGFNAIKSDLFEKVNIKEKFDLITFNAPYLPLDKKEPKDSRIETTGGKRGDEISLRFLREAFNYLTKNGKIFLLVSSLTPLDRIKKFNFFIVARKKIPFEELLILKFENEKSKKSLE
ncbi:MAG: methyltransferase [Candidatus Pacearchaeota archaeon]